MKNLMEHLWKSINFEIGKQRSKR